MYATWGGLHPAVADHFIHCRDTSPPPYSARSFVWMTSQTSVPVDVIA